MRPTFWIVLGFLHAGIGVSLARDSWDGWRWPADVTPAQAGAEIEAAVFLVGGTICMGVATILTEFARFRAAFGVKR